MLGRLSTIGLLAFAPGQIPARGLPDVAATQYRALLASTSTFSAAAQETSGLAQSFAEARAVSRSLGPFPVAVLSRGLAEPLPGRAPAEAEADEQVWRELQRDLAARAAALSVLVAAVVVARYGPELR